MDGMTLVQPFRRACTVQLPDVRRAVEAKFRFPLGPGVVQRLLFLGKNDQCLYRFNFKFWPREQLERMVDSLGLLWEEPSPRIITVRELRKSIPGSLSFWEAHGLIVSVVLLAAALGVMALFVVLGLAVGILPNSV